MPADHCAPPVLSGPRRPEWRGSPAKLFAVRGSRAAPAPPSNLGAPGVGHSQDDAAMIYAVDAAPTLAAPYLPRPTVRDAGVGPSGADRDRLSPAPATKRS